MTGHWYVDLAISLAAALVAYATIWRKGIKPGAKAVRRAWHGLLHAVEVGGNMWEVSDMVPALRTTMASVEEVKANQTELKGLVLEQAGRLDQHITHSDARDAAIEELRVTATELLTDFHAHKLDDESSFGKLEGAAQVLQSGVENLSTILAEIAGARREHNGGGEVIS